MTAGHFLCDQYAFVDATTGKFLIGYSEGHHSLPSALPADATAEVRAALLASGVTIVDARETTSTSSNIFACLSPVQTFQFDQEPQQATFRPGEKPPIDVLVFASVAQRQAAQHQISADGTGLNGARCGTIIDWVATPHWVGGGRYLLLVVSNDAALAARVAAAAARLGPP